MTKLKPVSEIEDYAVIIRCIRCRGKAQRNALDELAKRGLWLTPDQLREAGAYQ